MRGNLNYEVRKEYYNRIIKKRIEKKLTKIDMSSRLLGIKVDSKQILLSNYYLIGRRYDA